MKQVAENEPESSSAAAPTPRLRYDGTSIVLHWLTAVLIVVLWTIAQVIDFFPKGTPRISVRSTHIVLGAVLGMVLLIRVVWRTSSGRRLPRATPGLLGTLATLVHHALYVLGVATVVLGVFNAWARGDHFFDLFTFPKLAPDHPGLKARVEDLHATFANALMIVAGVHTAAALIHRFVLRNGVLQRMLPGK